MSESRSTPDEHCKAVEKLPEAFLIWKSSRDWLIVCHTADGRNISKNIFRFPASPAINDTLGAYCPTSGTGSMNSAEIRFGVPGYSRASGSECDRQEMASSWEKSGRRSRSHFRD